SPELSEVLAAIITRVQAGNERLPLLSRYDHAERLHSPPLPFLFQHRWGLTNVMLSPGQLGTLIHRITQKAEITHTDGAPARFTPHDFRRIFATEAVASGLPVHIAAKILGHDNLNTTQGYVALYDRDVIEHHRAFIARRRSERPSQEYREVTDQEWDEFLSHFEKRKVELGICGRAYATPCEHEHACLRCPLLRPDPNQLPRLEEIHANLLDRLSEAHDKGWAGEVDGLNISLAAADHKLELMRHNHQTGAAQPIQLGPNADDLNPLATPLI
ncbi:MAG: site-specific integrase, partial [Acidimicrobiales bacterium]